MTTTTHDELNTLAASHPIIQADPVFALRSVALNQGFERVLSSDQCEIWEHRDGSRVNLWIDAPKQGFQPGGLGFDDQTEWADS